MKANVSVTGLRELNAALGQFKKSTARSVLERALKKAAAPIAADAKRMAPVDTGQLRDSIGMTVVRSSAGKAAFAEAMASGATRAEAGAAAAAANRNSNRGPTATVRVRATAPHAHFAEWGTRGAPAHPFLGPALRSNKIKFTDSLRQTLGHEIEATAKRVAKRKAKSS